MMNKQCVMQMSTAKFRHNQMLRYTEEAIILPQYGNPYRPVIRVEWDEHWGCFTYVFDGSSQRIAEHALEADQCAGI